MSAFANGNITLGDVTAAGRVHLDSDANILFGDVSADVLDFSATGSVTGGDIVAVTKATGDSGGVIALGNINVGPEIREPISRSGSRRKPRLRSAMSAASASWLRYAGHAHHRKYRRRARVPGAGERRRAYRIDHHRRQRPYLHGRRLDVRDRRRRLRYVRFRPLRRVRAGPGSDRRVDHHRRPCLNRLAAGGGGRGFHQRRDCRHRRCRDCGSQRPHHGKHHGRRAGRSSFGRNGRAREYPIRQRHCRCPQILGRRDGNGWRHCRRHEGHGRRPRCNRPWQYRRYRPRGGRRFLGRHRLGDVDCRGQCQRRRPRRLRDLWPSHDRKHQCRPAVHGAGQRRRYGWFGDHRAERPGAHRGFLDVPRRRRTRRIPCVAGAAAGARRDRRLDHLQRSGLDRPIPGSRGRQPHRGQYYRRELDRRECGRQYHDRQPCRGYDRRAHRRQPDADDRQHRLRPVGRAQCREQHRRGRSPRRPQRWLQRRQQPHRRRRRCGRDGDLHRGRPRQLPRRGRGPDHHGHLRATSTCRLADRSECGGPPTC